MKLSDATTKPIMARQYMERYVNDGSPSGFSDLYRTSPHTDPFNLKPRFPLLMCRAAEDMFVSYGEIPNWPEPTTTGWIFLHPDMSECITAMSQDIEVAVFEDVEVTPTASSRTVQFVGKNRNDYVKLHYDGILGRVNRSIPYLKAVSGPEICTEMLAALDANTLPESLSILPETGARVLKMTPNGTTDKPYEVGMVWRASEPYGHRTKLIRHLWPLFSLFSTDRLSPLDDQLLKQLIDARGESSDDYVLHRLIHPILDSYFSLVLKLGYQVEWNAQNLMLGLDDGLDIISVVLRDIGRVEKDLTIRDSLDLPTDYESYPYKCITKEDELYEIRHSFTFDFKLSHYVIDPIVDLVCHEYGKSRVSLEKRIKEYVSRYLKLLPRDYFPRNGCWYKHDRILLVDSRPYVEMPNPSYR